MAYKLLTETRSSHKSELGLSSQVGQSILYLSPSNEAGPGINMCPGHSPECFSNCLVNSGQMTMPHAKVARVRKTLLLLNEPETFGQLLVKDIETHLRWTKKRDLLPSFRFNGTSDYHWETWTVPHLGRTLHRYLYDLNPDIMVNEYTKRYSIMKQFLAGAYLPNLYMTFSLHERNELQAREILRLGGNVTVVFRVKRDALLPSQWWGHPVLDGDLDDLRWLDRERARQQGLPDRGLIVGLRFKRQKGWHLPTPFVIDPEASRISLPMAA